MRRSFSFLLAISCVLLALLVALGIVQYRWSTRIAAADIQREKEHLDASGQLFASDFAHALTAAVEFLQNDAFSAVQAHQPLSSVPKLIGEIYFLEIGPKPQAQRLGRDGRFEPADVPDWVPRPLCGTPASANPPSIVAPIYHIETVTNDGRNGVHVLRMLSARTGKCFVARLDEQYLVSTFFPEAILRSFGATSAKDYDFAVVSHRDPKSVIYGKALSPDLRASFFSAAPIITGRSSALTPPEMRPGEMHGSQRTLPLRQSTTMIVQRSESEILTRSLTTDPLAHLPPPLAAFGPALWELQVAHKGMPLARSFELARRRDLALGMAVELLLATAIFFIVVSVRRMAQLAEQRMQFVAAVSHEVRTPVSAISMLSRNQADGLVSGPDKVRQYGELIHQQSSRLNDMLEQTLQYAGIHSGLWRPAKDPVDLQALIEEAVEARRDDFSRAGFEVELVHGSDLPPIYGDAKLLRTAIDNLISNAQKHAGSGRWIRVSSNYSESDKKVQISVEDRGPGIDPAAQAEIFEPFARGEAATEAQIPGSGLGLSLVRSATAAHSGTVTVKSEPGHGSVFTMHLPI